MILNLFLILYHSEIPHSDTAYHLISKTLFDQILSCSREENTIKQQQRLSSVYVMLNFDGNEIIFYIPWIFLLKEVTKLCEILSIQIIKKLTLYNNLRRQNW